MNESGRHSLMSHLLRKHVHFCEPHCPLTKKSRGFSPALLALSQSSITSSATIPIKKPATPPAKAP
ncbi:hypothetical protein HJA65_002493 [Vibrio vulnificus]|nr:hypothetical protein [Vibrio vulnificus]